MNVSSSFRGRFMALVPLLVCFACDSANVEPRVLVFGGPEAGTAEAAAALVRLAEEEGVELRMTTDAALLSEDSLARFRAVVLLNTSADELNRRQQVDLERFVEAGGGFLNLAAQPTRSWPWLAGLGADPGRAEGSFVVYQTVAGGSPGDYDDPAFLEELAEGFEYVVGGTPRYRRASTERVPDSTRFQQQVLVEGSLDEPTEMAIASDGRVFFTERRGALKVHDPSDRSTRVIHRFELFTENENGLIGIALDPAFDENGFIYLARTVGDSTDIRHRVARFTYDGEAIGDEKMLFDMHVDRGCCHTGGSMAFDGNGNLYVSFGDNTNPFATPYSPLDDSEGRALWDARRSSANTKDLRGKIVRITPQPDGTYTIPEGNLFADTTQGRPEIYTMGHRNPYRISVDRETGFVYWGEVGPDARVDSVYGPKGYDEVNQARRAGNFGWPLFIANNQRYRQRDFATGTLGELFDPVRPINESRFNTGARVLPPAEPAFIWYPYDRSDEFPLVGEGGRTAMAGPVYRSAAFDSDVKLPSYYDGKLIHYEWIRGWMRATTMNQAGDYVAMEPFLDHLEFDHPMDVEVGPDGALYILEYGTLWFAPNPGARLSRIVFHADNRPPEAQVTATPAVGAAPLQVALSAAGSADADGDELEYRWEFADGTSAEGDSVRHAFTQAGEQPVRMIATDGSGAADTAMTVVRVGNGQPEVAIRIDGNRSFFWESAPVNYHVTVRDPEDGALGSGIAPEQVRVTMDYQPSSVVEAQTLGHQTEQTPAGLAYIQQGDCTGCHSIDQQSVGPSYRAVAERYAGDEGASEYLMQKIIDGGSGVWGDPVMPAHPDLAGDVVREMVSYIRSLASPGEPLPPEGALALDRHAAGEAGAYLLTASYVDQPRGGMAPLRGRAQVLLRAPEIRAVDIADRWGVGMPTDSAASGAGASVRVEADGAYLHLGSTDLTGVGRVVFTLEGVRDDLTLELRAGSPRGERLAAGLLRGTTGAGRWEAPVPVSIEGERDLYLVFRTGTRGIGPWSPAARVVSIRFERGGQ